MDCLIEQDPDHQEIFRPLRREGYMKKNKEIEAIVLGTNDPNYKNSCG